MKSFSQKGFTLIELILVIGIVSIVASASAPFLSNFILRTNFEATIDNTIGIIRKAQNYSMDGKGGVSWGACKSGSDLRLFRGTCASPDFSEDFNIPGSVSVSEFDISFSTLRGEPTSSTVITINSSISSKTITLNSGGGMEIN